jgi:hypothetical protein
MEAAEYLDMKDTGDLLADLFTYSKSAIPCKWNNYRADKLIALARSF